MFFSRGLLSAIVLLTGQLHWPTADGGTLNPLHPSDKKVSVMFCLLSDCPIANGYAPEINRIVSQYKSKGIVFSIVYADRKLTAKEAKSHAHDFGFVCPLVLDPSRTLTKKAGAGISPEVVVVDQKHAIVYRGRIDDRAVEIGKLRPNPTRHDLRITLDALLARKPVPVAMTKAVGCIIGK